MHFFGKTSATAEFFPPWFVDRLQAAQGFAIGFSGLDFLIGDRNCP